MLDHVKRLKGVNTSQVYELIIPNFLEDYFLNDSGECLFFYMKTL